MKSYFKQYCLIILMVLSGSCKKYLDVVPPDVGTLDYSFRSRDAALNYLYACYSDIQQLNDLTRSPGFTTSSENYFPV